MSDTYSPKSPPDFELEKLTAINPGDIRLAAMDLLARREHSRRELKQKLLKRFKDDELVDEQLDLLASENLQSDSRFAESFLRQRVSRGHGPLRIRQEMRQRGISDDEIAAAMEAEQPDWYVLAEETYHRKYGALPAEDIREKSRRSRFMQYRGFSLDHFRHILE